MSCGFATSMTFAVYELYPDGREDPSYKTFSINKDENDTIMRKIGYCPSADKIDDYGLVLVMFEKLFNFTIGLNGFVLTWDVDENGDTKRYVSGSIGWVGPRAPAIRCGGKYWAIRRIT